MKFKCLKWAVMTIFICFSHFSTSVLCLIFLLEAQLNEIYDEATFWYLEFRVYFFVFLDKLQLKLQSKRKIWAYIRISSIADDNKRDILIDHRSLDFGFLLSLRGDEYRILAAIWILDVIPWPPRWRPGCSN